MKELIEKRGKLYKELRALLDSSKTENRAFTTEEQESFDRLENEIAELDRTIDAEKRAAVLLANSPDNDTPDNSGAVFTELTELSAQQDNTELRAAKNVVADYIRGNEVRANEMTTTSTGRIIPTELSRDIIRQVTALSGILNLVKVVNAKGDYKQIVADSENKITAGWTGEIEEIIASDAKFSTITISHYKLTALAKLSKELINQNDFDILSEVFGQMTQDFAVKSERAVFKGTGTNQPAGLISAGTVFELDSATAITADDIIRIYHALNAAYQADAVWFMSNDTLCNIRLLTDGSGRYLFHPSDNLLSGFAGTILGKPVLISDEIDNIGADNVPMFFGDMGRAYIANLNPQMEIQLLNELYAAYGMIGVLGTMWLDGKPVNSDAYVTVKCHSAG